VTIMGRDAGTFSPAGWLRRPAGSVGVCTGCLLWLETPAGTGGFER
jgi:hypothetical protein